MEFWAVLAGLLALCGGVEGANSCDLEVVEVVANIPDCLDATLTAARNLSPVLFPASTELQVHMDLHARVDRFRPRERYCCRRIDLPAADIHVNPLSDTTYETYVFRIKPTVDNFWWKADVPHPDNQLYTIGMFDIEVVPGFSAAGRPFVHWLAVNVQISDLTGGNTVVEYYSPVVGHTHVVLLYKQEDTIEIAHGDYDLPTSTLNDTVLCFNDVLCNFDVQRMVQEKSLTLVGATWINAEMNPYYRAYMQVQGGMDQADVCPDLFEDVVVTDGELDCDADPDADDAAYHAGPVLTLVALTALLASMLS